MTLTNLGFRAPSSVVIHPDWTHAFIGWEVGAITLIDLIHMTELNIFRSIVKSVSQMMIPSNRTGLLTFEMDNTVKIWDVDMLLETGAAQLVTDNQNGVMVYQRRLQGYVSIHVIDNSTPAPELISSIGLDNAYVWLITNIPLPDVQDQSKYRICICRAAAVEIYDLSELSLLKTFPISPISNDIPNMESKTGKR